MAENRLVFAVGVAFLSLASTLWGGEAARFSAVSLRVQPDHYVLRAEQMPTVGIRISRGAVDFGWVSLRTMILRAYERKAYQVPHPSWTDKIYSGRATFGPETPLDQVPAMMRTMLEERFGVRTHTETKATRVWLLDQAPGGAKLSKAADGTAAGVGFGPIGVEPGHSAKIIGTDPNVGRLVMRKGTMGEFCGLLSREAKFPVLDRTGLDGEYDIDVEAPTAFPRAIPPPSMSPTPPINHAPIPPLVLGPALKKLGLKLRQASEPMEMLILDAGQPFPLVP